MDNLVKPVDKRDSIKDWDLDLIGLWARDSARPWHTYSKTSFRRFWDDRYSVTEGNQI